MTDYPNLGGNSGVSSYSIGPDFIGVKFKGTPKTYFYSYSGKAGNTVVDQMKNLALVGQGLNAFINIYAKNLND